MVLTVIFIHALDYNLLPSHKTIFLAFQEAHWTFSQIETDFPSATFSVLVNVAKEDTGI